MSGVFARVLALTMGLAMVSAAGTAVAGEVRGRVHEGNAGPGIASLTVKLTAEPERGGAVTSTLTDANGQYDLGDVADGDYTLEVFQGTMPIYHSSIHVGGAAVTKDIELTRE